jgi:hypothetical protein
MTALPFLLRTLCRFQSHLSSSPYPQIATATPIPKACNINTMFNSVGFTWSTALTLALVAGGSAIPAPGHRGGHIRGIFHGNEHALEEITVYDSWDWYGRNSRGCHVAEKSHRRISYIRLISKGPVPVHRNGNE